MRVKQEQRSSPRHAVCRPCKVFHEATGRYITGFTSDVASGGALLDVSSPRPLSPGERIEVFVAWSDRVLLSAQDAIPAEVKRVLPRVDGRQLVGVQFERALAMRPMAAAA